MLQEAEKIDSPQIIQSHARLNLAFVANLFKMRRGLEALSAFPRPTLSQERPELRRASFCDGPSEP
jgi:hypothetical protein